MTPRRRQPKLVVGGVEIKAGEVRDVFLPYSETYLGQRTELPVRVIRGREFGPSVFFTGAIHGDELTGAGIVRELLFDRLPELRRGTLYCVPVVNTYGLENHSRYLPDRRDLNRAFPGGQGGNMTSRLAYVLMNEVIRRCDFGVDFHSAAVRRTNYPNIRADMKIPEVANLARTFGCELIVDGKGPEGSLRRTAVKESVPTVILEAGEVWKIEGGVVEIGVRGSLNVLRHLGMVDGEVERPLFQVTVRRTTWVRAERGGFLAFHAKTGDVVRKGQPLATNYGVFGAERRFIEAPDYGIILGMSTMPAVKPGEPVYHLAVISESRYRSVRRIIEKSSDQTLYNRLRDDMSTNIAFQEFDPNGNRNGG